MKKKINIKKWLFCTVTLLISMLAGTSCITDNDDLPDCPPEKPDTKEAPAVTASLYCNDKLIAWEEGKNIGVYLIDNEKEILLQDSLGAPYILNNKQTGFFIPQWGISDQVLARPTVGTMYDAIGIYPYGTSLKNLKSLSLSVLDQSHPEKLDVFIPRRISHITADTDTLHLDFYRRMSRLLFNLTLKEVKVDKSEVEANDKLTGATILINGLPDNGTFMLENDKLETGVPHSFSAYVTDNGQQGQAIVFPYKPSKDVRLQVSLPQCPDTLYSFVLDKDMALESCKSYTLPLDLKYIQHPVAKQYNVKYRFEGAANKDNVSVKRGTSPIAWGEGDIIRVDENETFTFQYQSSLKVSVRTEDGQTLSMTSGKPYAFGAIKKDITIIIYAEESKPDPEPEKTHKITYIYKGEANANNVHVYKNGMTDAWPLNQTLEVKDKASYTFGYTSGMIVSVKTKDGETLPMSSGKSYTFKNIEKDIEIIISAETPKYKVNYIFQGEHTEGNVNVQKEKGQSAFEAWIKTQTIWVTEGNNFSFKADQNTNSGFPITISVKVKGQEVPKNTNGSYTLKNLYEDITIVISTNLHKVVYEYTGEANKNNVSVYKSSNLTTDKKWTEKTEIIYVDHDTNFTFGTDSRHELVVTQNGKGITAQTVSTDNTKNTFELKNIQEDKKVIIGAKTEEDLLEHKVKYELVGAAIGSTAVTTSSEAWVESDAGVKTVADGVGFNFNAACKWDLTVTAFETNNPSTPVTVSNSNTSYSLSNIKKNVTVRISATTHNVSFTYNGSNANEKSVPLVTENSSWKPGSDGIVIVDDKGSFAFTNKSKFTITVNQEGSSNNWSIAPNASLTFNDITSDINLVVKVELYKVTYKFDNLPADQVATWVEVKLGSNSWVAEDAGVQYIEKGGSFTFDCTIKSGTNGRIVYVQESGADVSHSSNAYTISNILANKVIHIKAAKTYKMYYVFNSGTTAPSGFQIKGRGNTTVDNWQFGNIHAIIADAGSNFVFSMNKDLEVSATGGTFTLAKEGLGYQYTEENVQSDIVITLKAAKPYVSFTMPNEVTCDKGSDFVTSDSEFIFKPIYPKEKPETKYQLVVKYKKHSETSYNNSLTPEKDGSYKLPENVTMDMDIEITIIRKPADIKINATVKDWTELKTIPGGTIYPD